jgi:hypothetical protein
MIWLLLILAGLIRLPPIISGSIPFSFDHGRDALAAFHLIKTLNPVFIGPWTSIPGLFFGPGWYYLIAPAYAVFAGNPAAPVYLMLALNLIGIFLLNRYWGFLPAVLAALAPAWLTISTGAANPFPMVFLGILLLIFLKTGRYFWLGMVIGAGFHFSSALAIFWLAASPLLVRPRHWPKLIAGIIIPFIPQILFELKNNGAEIKAVINYFSQGETQKLTPGKISLVSQAYWHELTLAILPDFAWAQPLGWALLGSSLMFWKKDWRLLILMWLPLVGFWFLHYNPWYVYGILPIAAVITAKVLKKFPRLVRLVYLILLLAGAGIKTEHFIRVNQPDLSTDKAFLPAKLQALNYIYTQAGGRPFASYHYHPEIYDFAYQYLYIWQAFKGKPLPVDFSYQPGVPTYIPEKAGLLAQLPAAGGKPEVIFLIIEKPDNLWHYPFESWLKNINYRTIVAKKTIGLELEIWQLLP